MSWRTGHGSGKGQPRIEVLPADELPPADPAAEGSGAPERAPDGRFAAGASARLAGARGGAASKGRTKLAKLGLQGVSSSEFAPFRRSAASWRKAQCAELAQMLGGGRLGIAPSTCVATAALQLAASRYLFSQASTSGDAKLLAQASALGDASRQNVMAAWELAHKQKLAMPKETSPVDALVDALGEET